MTHQRRAFTLMEMLLVAALITITGIATFGTFQNGLRLWARGMHLSQEGDVAIYLDKASEDLRSALPISGIPFKGTTMRVSFPCTVLVEPDRNSSRAGEGIVDEIGAVEYRYEAADGKIYRRQAHYGQAQNGQWGPAQEVASGIQEFFLQYYFGGRSNSSADTLPSGVLMRVRLKSGAPNHELKRFFSIPAGER